MKKLRQFLSLAAVFAVVLVALFAARGVEAGWKKDGVEITTGKLATYTTENGNSVSDGNNGIIFIHKKNSKYYVQRLNSQAEKMWGDEGVFIVKDSSGKKMVADGSGGVFVVFNSGNKAYVQHVNKSGKKKWGIKGKMIYYGGKYDKPDNYIASDRRGGIFVASTFSLTGKAGQYVTYIGRVNKKGKILWRKSGDFGNKIISDKKGNVYTVTNVKDNVYHYKLTKLNPAGQVLWTTPAIYMHSLYDLILSNKNGIIIIGRQVNEEAKLFAWKVDAQGKTKWSGKRFSGSDSYIASSPSFVSDGKGGVIAVWHGYVGISAQRINTTGRRVWGKNDKLISRETEQAEAISDGQGGVIVRWIDKTTKSNSYLQKIDRLGNFQWGEGVKFSDGLLVWNNQIAMNAGKNKDIIILSDREVNNKHVGLYAYKLDRSGNILGE